MNKNYLAGFIDGEGYITWYRSGVRIIIGQKTKGILEEIKEYWESLGCKHIKIYNQTSLTQKTGKKHQGFRLQTANRYDAEIILEDLLPYLIIKKEDAWKTLEKIKEKHRNTKELKKEDVILLRRLGLDSGRIAKFYKCSNRKILKILREAGIKGRKGLARHSFWNKGQFQKGDSRFVQNAKNQLNPMTIRKCLGSTNRR